MKKYSKFLIMAGLALAVSLSSFGTQAADTTSYHAKAQSLQKADNPNKIIVDTLFVHASPEEKVRIQAQMEKYSKIQYGFGTAMENPSPTKDPDVLNNIKSHNPKTVKSQMDLMKEAGKELPHLQSVKIK
jgi:hypothetical protein